MDFAVCKSFVFKPVKETHRPKKYRRAMPGGQKKVQ
jgi:hypothetical protein